MTFFKRTISLAFAGVLILSSCKKENTARTALTIKVYNTLLWAASKPKGQLQEGVTVSLYQSKQDFKDNKPFKTGLTSANGSISFEVPEGKYFIVADAGGGLTNIPSDGTINAAGYNMGYVQNGLFQSQAEINSLSVPSQEGAAPGNFKWKDINADGIINSLDLLELPYEAITIGTTAVDKEVLVGNLLNVMPIIVDNLLDLNAALAATYTRLADFQKKAIVLDAVLSDDAACGGLLTSYCPLNNLDISPFDSRINELFSAAYVAIAAANFSIKNISDKPNLTAAEKQSLASFKACRGYVYMQLAGLFGTSPLVTESHNVNAPIYNSTQTALYAQAKKDLVEAQAELPDEWAEPFGRKRMNKFACIGLRAKIALLQKDYPLAESLASIIITNNAFKFSNNADAVLEDINDLENIWSASNSVPEDTYFASMLARGKYRPFLRLAEIYLIKAEALIALGRYTEAHALLDILAYRRLYSLVQPANLVNTTKTLQDIWKLEMYREGNRMACLIRWNKAAEVLGSNYKPHYKLLPIPMQELMLNANLVQNGGY